MSKHTPGPWLSCQHGLRIMSGGGRDICFLHLSSPNQEANAALIAAAPETAAELDSLKAELGKLKAAHEALILDKCSWTISLEAETDSLKAINAELLAALENIENDDEHMPATAWRMIQDAIALARE